jgi:alkaline phosphatase D
MGMKAVKRMVLGILVGSVLSPLGVAAAPEGVAGPMVGRVTSQDAALWMFVPKGKETTVTFAPEAGGTADRKVVFAAVPDPAVDGAFGPVTVVLDGLAADTRYQYQAAVGGETDPAWAGSFKTAPNDGTPGRFRVAVTSCMKFGQPQASWYLLLAQQPDLHLTIGDTVYADTTDPKVQWEHHLRYRRLPEFATVLRNVPTYSMWDDHDFGPNDSDRTAKGKENSLRGWKQFWLNPGAGTPETPGAFYKFRRGGVEFFVVDGRYHRSPDKDLDDNAKRMLGDAQFAWLLDGLKTSTAKFKVIASGSTLFHSKGDGWRVYTYSRHRLMDSIKEHKIQGVMYCSGDIHASLVWEHPESERVGYPFVEVVSSGVANSGTLSFATLDFDTAAEDPTVRVRIVWGDGTVRDDRTWRLSELGGM